MESLLLKNNVAFIIIRVIGIAKGMGIKLASVGMKIRIAVYRF